MGDPVPLVYQAAIFERGLPEYLEHASFTLMEMAGKDEKNIDFEYITTSLVNHDKSRQADESKAYAGKFGKQHQKGGRSSSPRQRKKCGHCGKTRDIKDCWHKHPENAPEKFKSLTKEECDAKNKKQRKKSNKQDNSKDEKKSSDTQEQDKAYSARFSKENNNKSDDFIIDSGDQEHVCWDRTKFTEYTPVKDQLVCGLNRNLSFTVAGVGTVETPAIINGRIGIFKLTNVRHVPKMEFNLLSTTQMDLNGYAHSGGEGKKTFYNGDDVVLQGVLHDRTYYLETKWVYDTTRALRLKSSAPTKNDASWTTWHKRFGHISMANTKAIARNTGIDCKAADGLQKYKRDEPCEDCISGKITRMPSR